MRAVAIAVIAVVLLIAGGWIANIVALASAATIGGMEVARAIGIPLFPIGVILGLFF